MLLHDKSGTRLVIGWREWVSLPTLHLPVIKAKVDTGAKTSSLHALDIETFSEKGITRVRFTVLPLQGRRDVRVVCTADVVDHRVVSDSGGHREKRYVIEAPVVLGGYEFPIEITLANRDTMSFRMLFGRSAMTSFLVEPNQSFLLGQPHSPAAAYRKINRKRL